MDEVEPTDKSEVVPTDNSEVEPTDNSEVEPTDNSVVGPILKAQLSRQRRLERKKTYREVWFPINQMRDQSKVFDSFFKNLRSDESKFFDYFKMSVASFDELLQRLEDTIKRRNTNFKHCTRTVESLERLALTLRYLAGGSTYNELHQTFRVGNTTVSKIIRKVCQALWKALALECLPPLTKDTWKSVADGFQQVANFPHCLGALGGKRIRIMRPNADGADLLVLVAIVDSQYRFVYAHTGSYERCCGDSSVFKQTGLWKSIESDSMPLPDAAFLPGIDDMEVPYFFAADAAFGLHKHLMRPFAGTQLTFDRRVFNSRLRRAQRFNECAFGILSNKWGIFHQPFHVLPDNAEDIVKACIILHNYVIKRDGYRFKDTLSIMGLEDIGVEENLRSGSNGNSVRNTLCKYFVSSEGQLPWQMAKI